MNRLIKASMWGLLAFGMAQSALAQEDKTPINLVFEDNAPQDKKTKDGQTVERTVENIGAGCVLALNAVEDVRSNKETVGGGNALLTAFPNAAPLFSISIRASDGKAWLEGAASSLKRYGFEVQRNTGAGAAPGALPLSLKLKLAHLWYAGFSFNSHVAVEANFQTPGGPQVRRYHGLGVKTNWWNGDSEQVETLNYGMADVLDNLARDAARACKTS